MMNKLSIFLMGLVCMACVERQSTAIDTKERISFRGVLSKDTSQDNFYARVLERAMLDLREDQFPQSIDVDKQMYRLITVPSVGGASVFRITTTSADSSVSIEYKRLSGFSKGVQIDVNLTKAISKDEHQFVLDSVSMALSHLDFWNLTNDWACEGGDGTVYFLEGLTGSKKKLICRWSPEMCDYQNAKQLQELINYFLRLKRID
ncbi:MAG TPA: hypothetical protein VIU12_31495 [Chryseolinea sp.]